MSSGKLTFVIKLEQENDAAIVYLTGSLVAGSTAPLRDAVKGLLPKIKRVVLDMTGLTRMDSMGLGTMVGLYVSAKSAGCEFKMINLGDRVRQLLIISKLDKLFEGLAETEGYDPRIF